MGSNPIALTNASVTYCYIFASKHCVLPAVIGLNSLATGRLAWPLNQNEEVPAHEIFRRGKDKARWTKIGVAWQHRDQDGLTRVINHSPRLEGNTVVREIKPRQEAENKIGTAATGKVQGLRPPLQCRLTSLTRAGSGSVVEECS
jgi:hypothetical protein